MICPACRQAADYNIQHMHLACPGETWCDCGHKPLAYSGPPGDKIVWAKTTGADRGSESNRLAVEYRPPE